MKKITALFLIIIIALSAAACAKELPGQPPNDESERLAFLTEQYNKARQIYELFDVCALTGTGEDTVDIEGMILSPADLTGTSLGFSDYAGMCELVNSLFSPEIASHLLESDLYREIDGILYTTDAARGTDITVGEVTGYEVSENGKDSFKFTVTYERMSEDDPTVVVGTDTAVFEYGIIGDKWVFTEFALYY